eukprot:2053894-Prymnesium_polylepis.1
MRQRPAFSMLGGAFTAWALLGPMARREGWASGKIESWEDGAQGWCLWVAMGLMLAEARRARDQTANSPCTASHVRHIPHMHIHTRRRLHPPPPPVSHV